MGVRVADWVRRLMSLGLVVAMFAATSGEAFGYRRPCAHHEAASLLAAPAADSGSHGDHAGHGAGVPGGAGEHSPCSCLGNCTITAPPAPPVIPSIEGVLPSPVAPVVVRPAPIRPVVQVRISHLIPFSQAPPLV